MKERIKKLLDKIKVVSDEEADAADFLVCIPADAPSPFADNLKGYCSHCGVQVQYRWHAPRKPKPICVACAVKHF